MCVFVFVCVCVCECMHVYKQAATDRLCTAVDGDMTCCYDYYHHHHGKCKQRQ